ncbi:hypothetical protein [Parasitella parasitica]|uniref:Tc1-like transposase DDE domain-containing protein n=2 Tax=Parasitella parasitica TaxID=35722 RepID=A0A0B7NDL4_9FUNG|nr:hypothetical protein [Parasitella parasitica]
MTLEVQMMELYLEDDKILQIDEDEPTEEVYVSLMSMMRANTAMHNTEAAMEIDDEVNNELYNGENLNVKTEEGIDFEDDEQVDLSDEVKKQSSIAAFATMMSGKEPQDPPKKPSKYRKYTTEQMTQFLIRITENMESVRKAAAAEGITERSAYRYKKQWNEFSTVIKLKRGRKAGTVSQLKDEHAMHQCLSETFPDLSVSKLAVYRYARTSCALSLKRLEKITGERNSERTLKLRKKSVQEWLADDEMDFERNCVFLDEAGFNLHITRNRGWSVKGTPAKVEVPTARGTSIKILGAISPQGIIDVSLRKPTTVSGSKKRRADGKVIETTARVGTRTEHFLFYLNNVMDVLDKNNLRGFYIVMDNAPIHKPNKVREYIEKRGFKCVYIPPYSPFLNPIEEFWSKVKFGVKRTPFDTGDTLTARIMESCSKVTQEDCIVGWIKHSNKRVYLESLENQAIEEAIFKNLITANFLHETNGKKARSQNTTEPIDPSHLEKVEQYVGQDHITVNGSNFSVGTIIKRAAMMRETNYDTLSPSEIALVDCGLNCILDLTRGSLTKQRKLFSHDDWNALKARFSLSSFNSNIVICRPTLQKVERIFINHCDAEECYWNAKTYQRKASSHKKSIVYELISILIEKKIKHKTIFNISTPTPSEADIMIKVWADIFEIIFHKTDIYVR